ncbi:MAG TPA: threonine synthase [Gemmatimonadales bacterium]|nr:threonine synthase [Gemmatimonadales bacterium]
MTGLKCVMCGTEYPARGKHAPMTCPRCGITGILDVQYDYRAAARSLTRRALARRTDLSQWRYRELLPLGARARLPALAVGWSPVVPAPALARHVGVRSLLLKDDGRNPSASLKDRASSVGAVKALEARRGSIACASTGNAASSLACMAASLGLKAIIFVPERAPEPKLAQLLTFGATVLRVLGSYDEAWNLCQRSCERWGWYNRNAAVNPYLVEGKKTVSLEICEQLEWRVPEWVAVSVGDGCTIAGTWKGFREMRALGLVRRTPKLLGVQAAGAAPVTEAFRSGAALRPVEPHTMADSIAVGVPRNWKKAVDAVRESGGTMLNVGDEEIREAMRATGALAGVFAEPAAAAAVAGLARAVQEGIVPRRSAALAVITGNGLKDTRAALEAAPKPIDVPPDLAAVEAALAR